MLDELIGCPKRIVDPPKKTMISLSGSLRNGMKVSCEQGRHFTVFMRISEAFAEDFSIGLQYEPPGEGSIILLRCNGPHGEFVNRATEPLPPHFGYHIHRAKKENIDEGRRAEAGAEFTTEYATFEGALKVFLRLANIKWTRAHFPDLDQPPLSFPE